MRQQVRPCVRISAPHRPSFEQLALDPLVPPARVLGGEPRDECGDLSADRRPAHLVWAGLLAGDQAAVPAQDGAGGDQPVHPQPCWQEPDEFGEDRGRLSPAGAGDGRGAARRPRAAAPAARHPWKLMTGRAGPASRRAGRRRDRAGGGTRKIMMPYSSCWSSLQITGHADFWHPTGRRPQPAHGTQARALDPRRPRLRDPPHRHAGPLPRRRHRDATRSRIDNIVSIGELQAG
jgi:hypothetical protein